MAYETRRERRLRLEAEKRRQSRQQVGGFLLTLLFLIISAVAIIYIGNRYLAVTSDDEQSSLEEQSDSDSVNDETMHVEPPPSDQGAIINTDLPIVLDQINGELGISIKSGLADLPNQTTTAVAMIDLSDRGYSSVNYNSDIQFTSASTYKIYVAYAMIHDVETGQKSWDSSINGTTWETCLSRMIINSDNACPERYLSLIGYSRFNEIVSGLGVSDKTVFALYDMRTTAADLALVLQKIYQGELMSDENKNRLFGLMEQQVYRQGIPAGVGDKGTVYDKVGFMDSLLHDAGIVHTDNGDYILVIMTNGESWQYIARIATYINDLLTNVN